VFTLSLISSSDRFKKPAISLTDIPRSCASARKNRSALSNGSDLTVRFITIAMVSEMGALSASSDQDLCMADEFIPIGTITQALPVRLGDV
jgi:hypothetical protein